MIQLLQFSLVSPNGSPTTRIRNIYRTYNLSRHRRLHKAPTSLTIRRRLLILQRNHRYIANRRLTLQGRNHTKSIRSIPLIKFTRISRSRITFPALALLRRRLRILSTSHQILNNLYNLINRHTTRMIMISRLNSLSNLQILTGFRDPMLRIRYIMRRRAARRELPSPNSRFRYLNARSQPSKHTRRARRASLNAKQGRTQEQQLKMRITMLQPLQFPRSQNLTLRTRSQSPSVQLIRRRAHIISRMPNNRIINAIRSRIMLNRSLRSIIIIRSLIIGRSNSIQISLYSNIHHELHLQATSITLTISSLPLRIQFISSIRLSSPRNSRSDNHRMRRHQKPRTANSGARSLNTLRSFLSNRPSLQSSSITTMTPRLIRNRVNNQFCR